jgi:hypothetical protein
MARLPNSVWEAWIRKESAQPRAWYRLSEPSDATVAVDSGPGHYDGTFVGNSQQVGSVTVHEPDQARKFDGVDDYVSLPAGAGPQGSSWTFEAWVAVADFSGGILRTLVNWGNSSTTSTHVGVFASDHSSTPGRVRANVNGTVLVGTSNILNQDRVHVAVVRDGSMVTLYVDGVAEDSDTLSSTGTASPRESLIGKIVSFGGGATFWTGTIDEVLVWDTALTAAQILAHYDAGNSPLSGDSPGARIEQLLDWGGWPAADRDIDDGESTLQSASLGGSVVEHLNKVGETEESFPFVDAAGRLRFVGRHNTFNRPVEAVFGDDPASSTEIGYTLVKLDRDSAQIYNEVAVTRDGGVQQIAVSTESIDDFGIRTFTRSALLNDTDADSRSHAEWLVNLHADDQVRRIDLAVAPQTDPDRMMPVVLGAELGQWYDFKRRPQGVGDAIELTGVLNEVSHRITPKSWRTSVSLSPIGTQSVLTFDSTAHGRFDVDVLAW